VVCLERNAPSLAFPGIPQCFTFAGSGDRAVLKCNPIYLADRIQDMFCDQTWYYQPLSCRLLRRWHGMGPQEWKIKRGYQWSLVRSMPNREVELTSVLVALLYHTQLGWYVQRLLIRNRLWTGNRSCRSCHPSDSIWYRTTTRGSKFSDYLCRHIN